MLIKFRNRNVILFSSLIFLMIFTNSTFAQTDTVFWFAAPEVSASHEDRPIYFRLSSADQLSDVTISQPANPNFAPISVQIQPYSTQSINLTPYIDIIENKPANTLLNYGLLIRATTEITAYYEVGILYNPEIFSLKGRNALGTEFYTPFQNFANNGVGYSSFDIVATEENTIISITPTNNIVGYPANETFTVTLNRGQTYSATAKSQLASLHLCGSHVKANKPIAVTIKDDSLSGIRWGGCLDLAGDQIVPVNKIGTEYIVMKGFLNYNIEKVFILAVYDNTQLFINGSLTPNATINLRETYSCDITQNSTYFKTSKPVYFLHMSGFGCELGVTLLPSIKCSGSGQISFVRSTDELFGLNIMTKNGNQGNFILNDNQTIINANSFHPVPGTNNEWVAAQLTFSTSQIKSGAGNVIRNTSGVFHLGMINGGSTSGCRYAFFSAFNKYSPKIQCKYLCINDSTNFQLSDASVLDSVHWNFNDPASNQNNSTLYEPKHVFSMLGTYNVRAIFYYECGTDTVFQQVNINPLPLPTINSTSLIPENNVAIYNSEASMTNYKWIVSPGGTIITGEGTEAVTVKWNAAGSQTVSVNYVNSNGCTAEIATVKNVIVDLPVVKAIEAFSPNGDGINDFMQFNHLDYYPGSKLFVFSKIGNIVYQGNDYQNDWGGRIFSRDLHNQSLVLRGTYYYLLKLGGTNRIIKGFVLISY